MSEHMVLSLSLRIWHPSISAEAISHALGEEGEVLHSAGAQRRTPRGGLLSGTYRQSYWCSRRRKPQDGEAAVAMIESWMGELEPARGFLERVQADGGEAEFYVVWSAGRIPGLTLSAFTLRRLSAMGISLSIEVFSGPAGGTNA